MYEIGKIIGFIFPRSIFSLHLGGQLKNPKPCQKHKIC